MKSKTDGRIPGDLAQFNQHFASVSAREQTHERVWGIFNAFHHSLLELHLTAGDPRHHIALEVRLHVGVRRDDEASIL